MAARLSRQGRSVGLVRHAEIRSFASQLCSWFAFVGGGSRLLIYIIDASSILVTESNT